MGNGPAGTRGIFPQTSPDLRVRWCSPALKIDVLAAAIRNQPRFLDGRTLVITGERDFRIDRIRSIERVGSFTPVRAEPPTDVWDPGADAQRVVLDIPAPERWVVEAYPVEWEDRGDAIRVTLNVLGTAWLERLLLKLGPDARVIEPPELRTLGAEAARRLLEAY